MRTIATAHDLYNWAREMNGEADDAVNTVMHLLQNRLTDDEWSLTTLCAPSADAETHATPNAGGIRLESKKGFAKNYGVKIDVVLPHQAFSRFSNNGRDHLMFDWHDA